MICVPRRPPRWTIGFGSEALRSSGVCSCRNDPEWPCGRQRVLVSFTAASFEGTNGADTAGSLRRIRSLAERALAPVRDRVTSVEYSPVIRTARFALRDSANRGLILGPRISAAGGCISLTGGHGDGAPFSADVHLPRGDGRLSLQTGPSRPRQIPRASPRSRCRSRETRFARRTGALATRPAAVPAGCSTKNVGLAAIHRAQSSDLLERAGIPAGSQHVRLQGADNAPKPTVPKWICGSSFPAGRATIG